MHALRSGNCTPEWLAHRAASTPDRPALITAGVRLTFAELDRLAALQALQLASSGTGRGDRVALLMRNSISYAVCLHAVSRIGAVAVPLNNRLTPIELTRQLESACCKLLLCDPEHTAVGKQLGGQVAGPVCRTVPDLPGEPPLHGAGVPPLREAGESAAPAPDKPPLPAGGTAAAPPSNSGACGSASPQYDLDAPHTILYTSGTTGSPKGVVLTYGNHLWSAVGSAFNLGIRADDVWLAVLPFFHAGGLAILMRSVLCGFPVLIHAGFDPAGVNRAIDQDGVTIVSVVSNMLGRMLDERGGRPYPPSLRCVLTGGGPVPLPLLQRCHAQGVPVVQTYGLTETASQVVTLPPEESLRKAGSAGKPLFPTEIRIVRDREDMAAGLEGEIVVRGPTVTPGYDRDPEATSRAIHDGWLHTGDWGYRDEEGFLYVLDRRKDLIISGGENVYPAEIEAALLEHPDVLEAGVAGIPDDRWGQVPAAAVVCRGGHFPGEESLKDFLALRIARYKIPVLLRQADALPRTASGKLQRHLLAAWLHAGGKTGRD